MTNDDTLDIVLVNHFAAVHRRAYLDRVQEIHEEYKGVAIKEHLPELYEKASNEAAEHAIRSIKAVVKFENEIFWRVAESGFALAMTRLANAPLGLRSFLLCLRHFKFSSKGQ